jgi:asparagine synthase (glutamine-hydrolysing)
MCGIAGVLKLRDSARASDTALDRMCAVMRHRGPDDQGSYADDRIALGIRRLSIIDLTTGHQPISNEDRSIWIVFNGEIYNHVALRKQLTARGHRFSSQSDTEVIVHLYEEFGHDCIRHLRGMFAFAIWDSKKRGLFVARDRLGIKPLYYAVTPDFFLFGSEIKVLLANDEVRREFDPAALPEYLAFGYLSHSATFYAGIHKLMPGHWLEIDETGQLRIEQYWDLVISDGMNLGDEQHCVNEYRDLLENAVRSHMMSDVPLGVFLSGGLDSSVIAALMARHEGAGIQTFSVGYSEQEHSELSFARVVKEHLKTVHHEVLVSEQDFFNALPKLIWHEDEPVVWPSSVPLYFVAQLARQWVKVVLTGEGSDETLAGYTRYAFTVNNAAVDRMYRHLTPGILRNHLRKWVSSSPWIGADLRRGLSHTFLARDGESWASFYLDSFFSAFSEQQQKALFHEDLSRQFEAGAAYRHVLAYWKRSTGNMLQRLLYTDIKTYLVELLMKQDNMSMAASVESRVPFLDHSLVEFALRIPQDLLLKGLAGKRILKKAVEDLLPHSIIYRPKQGFPTPWSQWLAGQRLQFIHDLLMEKRSTERGLFKPVAIERLFREHSARSHDHGIRIWRLLNLELWFRTCLEERSSEAIQENEPIRA